jgi:hypothetical protein
LLYSVLQSVAMTSDDLLKRGIAALQAGRKAEARTLLVQALQQDKRNETAWLWLSGAVDTDAERRACLEEVLAINPGNEMARRGLERLQVSNDERPENLVPRSPLSPEQPIPVGRKPSFAETSIPRTHQSEEPPTSSEARVEVDHTVQRMKLEQALVVQADESTARARAAAFLERSGYERIGVQPYLQYRRGSQGGWLRLVSPKGWLVNVTVQTTPVSPQSTHVTMTSDVDTTDQTITGAESKFWAVEFDGLSEAIRSGEIDVTASAQLAQSSVVKNAAAYALVFGLALTAAVVARLLFASRFAFWVGGMLGLGIGLGIAKATLLK